MARQGGLRPPCRPAATRRPVRSAQDHSSQQHGPQQPPFAACGLSTGAVGSHTTVARQLRPEVDGWAEELSGRQKEAARHLLRDLRRDQVARHAPCSPLPAPTSAAQSPGLTARLRAGYRGLVGARAAGTASAHREEVQRQAAPGETLGSSKEAARRHAVDAAAADLGSTGRFDSRRQPFLARLTAGWGCAQPHRRGRRGTSPEKTSHRLRGASGCERHTASVPLRTCPSPLPSWKTMALAGRCNSAPVPEQPAVRAPPGMRSDRLGRPAASRCGVSCTLLGSHSPQIAPRDHRKLWFWPAVAGPSQARWPRLGAHASPYA